MREMKDSGIEWIGNIPGYWNLTKIGMLYTLRNIKVNDKDYPPLSVTKLGVTPQLDTVAKTNAHDARKLVKKGDFAINSRSDRKGSCGISKYDGSVSLINTVLTPKGKMNPNYYDWLFHTTQFAEEFYKNGHGIVDDLWTTNWQDMKKITLPTPPIEEQQKIANFLDSKCSEIDAIATDIQNEITVLKEYKKSVITEAVTKGLNPNVEMKDSEIAWIGEISQEAKLVPLKYLCKLIRGGSPRPISSYLTDSKDGLNWIKIGDAIKGKKYITKTKFKIKKSGLQNTRFVKKGSLIITNSMSFGLSLIHI